MVGTMWSKRLLATALLRSCETTPNLLTSGYATAGRGHFQGSHEIPIFARAHFTHSLSRLISVQDFDRTAHVKVPDWKIRVRLGLERVYVPLSKHLQAVHDVPTIWPTKTTICSDADLEMVVCMQYWIQWNALHYTEPFAGTRYTSHISA
jgi:hypothetical protein